MLFEELVEQHRVHRFVADRVRLALVVTSHQIGINLFHFLSHKAKLPNPLGIQVMFIMERYRSQREKGFARLVHRLDRVLETLRGDNCAEVTIGIDDYPYASSNGCSTNTGDKRMRVSSFCANADVIGLASFTFVANIDVVTAGGEIGSGGIAQGDVAASRCVIKERKITAGRIVAASGA